METADRISVAVEAATRVLVVAIFAFMLGAVLLDVAARNLPYFRVRGLDELARYSQVWFIFLVTGVGARYGELIGTEFVVKTLPRKLQMAAWLLGRMLMFIFLGLLAYYAWQLLEFLVRTRQTSANLRFPLWWAYLPLFIGTALMLFSLLVDLLVRLWQARRGGDLIAPPDQRKGSVPWS